MAERLYSVDQVADLVGASPADIAAWIRTGWLAGETLPGGQVRVSEAGLVRFLKERGIDLGEVLRSACPGAPGAEAAASPGQSAIRDSPWRAASGGLSPSEATGPPFPARRDAPGQDGDLGADAAGRLAQAILRDALARGAEAIHLEPQPHGLVLRLRIDGHLREKPNFQPRLPKGLAPRLMARLAGLAGSAFLLGGPGAAGTKPAGPRTGTFRVGLNGRSLEFRVAACPTAYGDRLVIRPAGGPPRRAIEDLGFLEEDLSAVRRVLEEPSGLVLVAGPPRSGRTTTLRALAAHVAPHGRKVLAVDRRDAFDLPGVDRVVAPGAPGLAGYVRAGAAQAVDVLVVDEVRDGRTAAASVEAALDGHLVLAALASRAAWPDPTALVSARVDAVALSTALVAVIVQRLVRTVCPHCTRQVQPDAAEAKALRLRLGGKGGTVAVADGCPHCHQTGYAGRTGLYSVLCLDEALAKLVAAGTDGVTVRQAARKRGLKSLRRAARQKVKDHQTSPNEVIRVLRLA
jgi:type II secretory ATPase GspE/PulE/Tfp pilus assembly ATPase PilB-like protein